MEINVMCNLRVFLPPPPPPPPTSHFLFPIPKPSDGHTSEAIFLTTVNCNYVDIYFTIFIWIINGMANSKHVVLILCEPGLENIQY